MKTWCMWSVHFPANDTANLIIYHFATKALLKMRLAGQQKKCTRAAQAWAWLLNLLQPPPALQFWYYSETGPMTINSRRLCGLPLNKAVVCLDGVNPEPTLSPNEWPQDTVFSASESHPEHWTADRRMWQLTQSRASNGHELPKEPSSRMPPVILWAHFKQEVLKYVWETVAVWLFIFTLHSETAGNQRLKNTEQD